MLPRMAYPGIFELFHSMGKVIGVSPSTLKSYALCVYFQMYSPSSTKETAEGLLDADMELVSPARTQGSGRYTRANGAARPNLNE